MRKTIPEHEIKICDVCHRESNYLDTCPVCGREYCIVCEAIISGCIHKVEVCRMCGDMHEVMDIAERFAPKIKAVLLEREAELAKLNPHSDRIAAD